MPDGERGGDGGRAVESVVDREVVSDRVPGLADTMSSGGRIDGQKSRSKKPGTSTRRLYAGVSRGRTVTTCGVGTWPRISIVDDRGACVRGLRVGCCAFAISDESIANAARTTAIVTHRTKTRVATLGTRVVIAHLPARSVVLQAHCRPVRHAFG